MNSCKFTPFGLCVKTELLREGLTQEWLVGEIRQRTGLYADCGYLYKIFTGQRSAPKIVQAIQNILNLPSDSQDSA